MQVLPLLHHVLLPVLILIIRNHPRVLPPKPKLLPLQTRTQPLLLEHQENPAPLTMGVSRLGGKVNKGGGAGTWDTPI